MKKLRTTATAHRIFYTVGKLSQILRCIPFERLLAERLQLGYLHGCNAIRFFILLFARFEKVKSLIDESFAFQKEEYILHDEGWDLISSLIQLSDIEPSLANAMSRESLLKQLLSPLKEEYDYII